MNSDKTNFFAVRYAWTDARGERHQFGTVATGPTPAAALANFRRENPHVRAELVESFTEPNPCPSVSIRGLDSESLVPGSSTSQECASQRRSAGIDLAPPLSDTGIPSPVAAPTLTTGQFKAEVRSQSSEVSR